MERFDRKVLLVEDHAINRKLATALLARIGCTPDIAVNGCEAVERACSTRYDVILMDIQMPEMDGLVATQKIREWEKANGASRTRIIALTANALAGDRETCIEAGMDDYIPKPLHFQTLRNMIVRSGSLAAGDTLPSLPASRLALGQLASELSVHDVVVLAKEFMEDLGSQLGEIRAALNQGDLPVTQRLAHSLKGSSSIFALEGLRHVASELESACAAGDGAGATLWLRSLETASREAREELEAGIRHLSSSTTFQSMS